ncbi:MAG TPA: hypothetical protein VIV11_40270 [Kofleriaceae bacterium]
MRIVVALMLFARLAHADVGVVVSGDPQMQASLMAHVQGWLQTREFALVAVPMGSAANSFIDCFVMDDMGCAKRTFDKESKASSIVFARADLMAGRDYTVVTYWFIKGHEPQMQKAQCKNCDEAQFAAIVKTLMIGLEKATAPIKGRLKIMSALDGVMVSIDNAQVGPIPLERELSSGPHQLAFLYRGSVIESKPIRIEPGATLEVKPPPLPADPAPPPKPKSRTLPTSLIIGGAALAVAGGVFMYYGSLGGPDEPYVYTNATEIGIPLSIAGAVGVVGGIVWAGTF